MNELVQKLAWVACRLLMRMTNISEPPVLGLASDIHQLIDGLAEPAPTRFRDGSPEKSCVGMIHRCRSALCACAFVRKLVGLAR